MVRQAGAWRAPPMQSSHWGVRTRSAVALEAAGVWSEQPEENPGCSSGSAHQPKGNKRRQKLSFHCRSSSQRESVRTESTRWYDLLVFSHRDKHLYYQQHKHIRRTSHQGQTFYLCQITPTFCLKGQ